MRAPLLIVLIVLALATPVRAQTAVMINYLSTTPLDLTLTIAGPPVAEMSVDAPEVLLRFEGGIAPQQADRVVEANAQWIETIEYGYDTLLLRFAPRVDVEAHRIGKQVTLSATLSNRRSDLSPSASSPEAAGSDPQRVRLDFYRALAQIESGSVTQGRAILVRLHREDARNIEVTLLLAQAEERLKRPRAALALYDQALALDPGLPAAMRDRQRLARDLSDFAQMSNTYQDVERGETQIITSLDGRHASEDGIALVYKLENRNLDTGALTRRDGGVEAFEGNRQRATFTVVAPRDAGLTVAGSLFASNDVMGAGVELKKDDGPQTWTVDARVSEPNFNYVEGIVDGGGRDRLALGWQRQVGEVYDFSAGSALNRYTLGGDHAGAGVEVSFEARRRLAPDWPQTSLGYRLDGEYMLNSQDNDATTGDLLPLSSREGHTLDAATEGQIGDYITARGLAGYTYDRLNGGGPLAEISLLYEPLVDLEISTTLGTSLTESRGTENQLFYGGVSVRTRF